MSVFAEKLDNRLKPRDKVTLLAFQSHHGVINVGVLKFNQLPGV